MAFDLTYLIIGIALLVAAFVKGATGLGFPLIATPTLALLLDIRIAVTVLILPNLFMDSAQVLRDGVPYEVLRRFKNLILPTIIGVFLGTLVMVKTPLWILNLCLGVMVLIFVFSSLLKFDFTVSPRREKFLSPLFGFVSGFLNGVTNAAGPTLAIYLYNLKLEKRAFVKTIATTFVITKLTHLEFFQLVHDPPVDPGAALHPGGLLRRHQSPGSGQSENLQSRLDGAAVTDRRDLDPAGGYTSWLIHFHGQTLLAVFTTSSSFRLCSCGAMRLPIMDEAKPH